MNCKNLVTTLFLVVLFILPSLGGADTGWNRVPISPPDGVNRPGQLLWTMADTDATTGTLSGSTSDIILNSYNLSATYVSSTTTAIAAGATGTVTVAARESLLGGSTYIPYRAGVKVNAVRIYVPATSGSTGAGTVTVTNTGNSSYTPTLNDALVNTLVPAASYDDSFLHGAKRLAVMAYDSAAHTPALAGSVTISGADVFGQPVNDTITVAGTSYALTSHAYTTITSIAVNVSGVDYDGTDQLRIGVWGVGIPANATALNSQFSASTSTTVTVANITSANGVWSSKYHTWYPNSSTANRRTQTAGITAGITFGWSWYSNQTGDSPTSTAVTALPGTGGTGLDESGFGYTE